MEFETALILALVGTALVAMLELRPRRRAAAAPSLDRHVAQVLARELRVAPRDLSLDAPLADLGCAGSDVVELASTLELEFGVIVPERRVRELRTCRDVVETICALAAERAEDQPPFVSARLVAAKPVRDDVRYTGWLTSATARSLAAEAFRAGPGTRLVVEVHDDADDVELCWVADQFAWLRELGIRVGIDAGTPGPAPAA